MYPIMYASPAKVIFRNVIVAVFCLLSMAGQAQTGAIVVNGISLPVSSSTKFPIWLPGGTGATVAPGSNVTNISGIVYNIEASSAGGNILTLNSVVNISASTPIAAGTALKIEGILFTTTSTSSSTTWNVVGNATGGAGILGTTDNSAVTLQSGTGALGIGSDAAAKTITIGNSSVGTSISENVGPSSSYTLNGTGNSSYSIGSSTTTGTISIGGATQTGTISIGPGSGVQTIGIGGAASTVAVGGIAAISGTLAVTGASALSALNQTGTTNINTSGTAVTNIGNSSGGVFMPGLIAAGVVHTAAGTGKLSTGPIVMTTDISGVTPIANGGTNTSTIGTAGQVEYSNGTAHAFTATSGAANQVLHGSAAGAPSFSQVNLASGGDVTGVLPVANGGTGSSSASTLVSTHFAITSPGSVQTINSNTPAVVTGLSITFTPASNTSKFLILATINGSATYVCSALLYRNGSAVLSQANTSVAGANVTFYIGAAITTDMYQMVINYLDAPATASSITYDIRVATTWAGSPQTTYINSRSGNDMTCPSTLTILEFAQ